MEIRFTNTGGKHEIVFSALFLGTILCAVFATLDWLYLLPAVLLGVLLALIPKMKERKMQYLLWGILALWLAFRFPSILDGGKLLANRMFELSEQRQSYEYDYFAVSGESAVETTLWLSILTGFLCARWGNKANSVLCGGWVIAMAYFGVTPGAVWLVILLLTGLLTAIPGQQRWFYGLLTGLLVAGIAVSVTRLAPEPSKAVSALDNRLRDVLAVAPVTYEQTPIPTEVPEPEIVPQPRTELEQPDHGVQKMVLNILFLVLAALTLALLFIPAVIKDAAAKRSERARAGIHDSNHAAAIRAMYLYAKRWRGLSDTCEPVPDAVYALWQEAAYSDHMMTEEQRKRMYDYLKETAETVWKEAGWRKRLEIRYRIAL